MKVCFTQVIILVPSFTEKIRKTPGITAVFLNVERLSPSAEVSLQMNYSFLSKLYDDMILISLSHHHRGSFKRPGGLRSLTDTQLYFIFSAAMLAPKKQNFRSLWQKFPF